MNTSDIDFDAFINEVRKAKMIPNAQALPKEKLAVIVDMIIPHQSDAYRDRIVSATQMRV